jgi:hypothetical protein
VRSFITSLIYSYQRQSHQSRELEFLSRYFMEEIKIPLSVIKMNLKLRKNIISTFIDARKEGQLENHSIKLGCGHNLHL